MTLFGVLIRIRQFKSTYSKNWTYLSVTNRCYVKLYIEWIIYLKKYLCWYLNVQYLIRPYIGILHTLSTHFLSLFSFTDKSNFNENVLNYSLSKFHFMTCKSVRTCCDLLKKYWLLYQFLILARCWLTLCRRLINTSCTYV